MFEKIKEVFSSQKAEMKVSVQDQLNDLLNRVQAQGVSFKMAKDIFTDHAYTIHQEKAKCKKAYNSMTFVQSAVDNLMNVIEGEYPGICSESEMIDDYADKWEVFSNFKRARKEALQESIITGDGYIRKVKGSKGSFKYMHIENSEDIYIDWDFKENRPKRYIQRLWYTEARAKQVGIKAFTLNTIYGTETIFGIEYGPEEIIHLKFKTNYWSIYGRSPIASALNDIDIVQRMERSIAVIAMFKAIPQKIITPKQVSGDRPVTWSQPQVNNVAEQLKSSKEYENPLVGTSLDALNLTDSGQMIDMTGYLDYFKRKISISLSPEFIIHGELINRSTSVEQKQFFYLAVVAIRDYFTDDINACVQEGMTASLKVLSDMDVKVPAARFWFEWGDYDVMLREETNIKLLNEWREGLITHGQYREAMGYDIDPEMEKLYKFDVMSSSAEQKVETIEKVISDAKETKKSRK